MEFKYRQILFSKKDCLTWQKSEKMWGYRIHFTVCIFSKAYFVLNKYGNHIPVKST